MENKFNSYWQESYFHVYYLLKILEKLMNYIKYFFVTFIYILYFTFRIKEYIFINKFTNLYKNKEPYYNMILLYCRVFIYYFYYNIIIDIYIYTVIYKILLK